jgi:RNA polymerase sigma factor (sigma-70 family)
MQAQQLITSIDMTALSDGCLAQQTLAGDQRAFEIMVQRYHTSLFNFICHFLGDYDQACDVLQQVFLRFFTSLPKLGTDEPFKPWLFQVARNCCVDELRRRRRYALQFSQLESENDENDISLLNEIPDTSPLPEDLAERHDLQQVIGQAIQSLPPKFRAVVLLRYTSQLSFSEIGRTLNMPEATAKTYFHRAKILLRKLLSGQLQTAYAS